MRKASFIFSIVLHVIFIYWFTTLKFTHRTFIEERKEQENTKEVIVVTPVKLFMPVEKNVPVKKEVLVIESTSESLKRIKGKAGERTGRGNSEKPGQEETIGKDQEQTRKIVKILESSKDRGLSIGIEIKPGEGDTDPTVEPKFSLNPKKIREIISKINSRRMGKGDFPDTSGEKTAPIGGSSSYPVHGCNIKPWARRAISRVKDNWSIPLAVEMGAKGLVAVSIIVEKDGKISSINIKKSSDFESLDKAALTAFTLSNPLPKLPKDFPYHNLRAYFVFNYNISEILQIPGEREIE